MRATILLLPSARNEWTVTGALLRRQSDLRVVDEAWGPEDAVASAAARRPAVILVASEREGTDLVGLVRRLRAASPASKIIVIDDRKTLRDDALPPLAALGLQGYLLWDHLRPAGLPVHIRAILEEDMLLTNSTVLAGLLGSTAQAVSIQDPVPAAALWETKAVVEDRPEGSMRATLWGQNREISALLRFIFAQAAFGLTVVDTAEALLAGSGTSDVLIVECAACTVSEALARGMAIVQKVDIATHVIHADSAVVEALRTMAHGELAWLSPRDIGLSLLEKLRMIQFAHLARMAQVPTTATAEAAPLLTPTEQRVYRMLVEEGLSTHQIAARLVVGHETARTHIAHILGKHGVHSREALRAAHQHG